MNWTAGERLPIIRALAFSGQHAVHLTELPYPAVTCDGDVTGASFAMASAVVEADGARQAAILAVVVTNGALAVPAITAVYFRQQNRSYYFFKVRGSK